MTHRTLYLLFLLFTWASSLTMAQDSEPAAEEEYSWNDMAAAVIDSSLQGLQNAAPKHLKAEMSAINYQVLDDADPNIIRNGRGDSGPVIEMSVGAFILMFELSYASAATIFIDGGPVKFNRWLEEVATELKQGKQTYPGFLDFVGEKEPESEYFSAVFMNNLFTLLTFIVAHESGHIVLAHDERLTAGLSSEEFQQLEVEADELAVELLAAVSGDNAQAYVQYGTGYSSLFFLSMLMNRDILAYQSMRDHPPEPERAVRMARTFKARAKGMFTEQQDKDLVDQAFDNKIKEYEMYLLILEYNKYVNAPENDVISFDEWRQTVHKK